MVRFGHNPFQSVVSVVLYAAVVGTIGFSIATAFSPFLA